MSKILVFSAHPDDAESCVGGTILNYRKEGAEVRVVHMTAEPLERKREGEKAAAVLDVKVSFLGLKQRKMWVDKDSLKKVKDLIIFENPDIILTHWPVDFHPDHQATGILVLRALNELEEKLQPILFFYEAATGYQSYYFKPDKYVDATPYLKKKRESVACHKSQKPFKTRKKAWYILHETMMKFRGYESGFSYAEALVKLPFRYKKVRDKVI